jgi:hypothetical protein
VALATLGLAACSSTGSRALVSTTTSTTMVIPPGGDDSVPGLQPPAGFKVPDTRNAVLLAAPGKAKATPIPVTGGRSTITGTVNGPDGPVVGATVRIERFVGTASGSIQVGTDGGGRFVVSQAMGGRYRVRAWLQPDLSTFSAPTGFVADGDSLDLSPSLERHNAVTLQLAGTTATLTMGEPSGVKALLVRETVDADGIVRPAGVVGSVITLVAPEGITINPTNPATSDADGAATWVIVCTSVGSHQLSASSPEGSASVTLPPCSAGGPTTTTTTPGGATTTTAPGSPTTGPGR